ncbi:MAG: hypothetical protein LKI78_06645 [Bifidobacterium tibiigranuli]|jgi:hypothetical protein|nr:hypothetical protein [Bifidobacterium tibiigranuli]
MASTPHSPNTRKSSTGRGASGTSGASGGRQQRGQRRKPSKEQQQIFRRRRIVAAVALVLVLAFLVFCVYSLGRGVAAVSGVIRHDDLTALTRNEVPGVKQTSGVRDCTANDVKLELSAQSQTVPVGGSLDFTMTVAYEGTSSCLIDVSNASRILTITSGSDTIWRSDACPADPHRLLMSKGDRRVDTLTWNADSTGSQCVDDASLPRVNPGTYMAKLSLKNDAKAVSDPVPVIVQ